MNRLQFLIAGLFGRSMLPSLTPLVPSGQNAQSNRYFVDDRLLVAASNGVDRTFTQVITSYGTIQIRNDYECSFLCSFRLNGNENYACTVSPKERITLHFQTQVDSIVFVTTRTVPLSGADQPSNTGGLISIYTASAIVTTDERSLQSPNNYQPRITIAMVAGTAITNGGAVNGNVAFNPFIQQLNFGNLNGVQLKVVTGGSMRISTTYGQGTATLVSTDPASYTVIAGTEIDLGNNVHDFTLMAGSTATVLASVLGSPYQQGSNIPPI